MYTRDIRGDREYTIYTKAEAEEKGIEWVYWKDAEEGQWGITDDDYVMECRKRYEIERGNDHIVFSGGKAFITPDANLEFEPHLEHGSFYLTKAQDPMEKEARSTRTRVAIMRVASELVNNTPWSEIPWYDIGSQMRPDMVKNQSSEFVINWTKKLFKSQKIMDKVQKKVVELFDEFGLSNRDIVTNIKKAVDLCLYKEDGSLREEPDITNLRHLLRQVSEMKGIDKPKQRQVSDEWTADYSKQITGDVERESKKLTAKRTKMIGDGEQDEE